jgi:hypothetical protein
MSAFRCIIMVYQAALLPEWEELLNSSKGQTLDEWVEALSVEAFRKQKVMHHFSSAIKIVFPEDIKTGERKMVCYGATRMPGTTDPFLISSLAAFTRVSPSFSGP